MTYGSSNMIKNILKEAGFKDNVFTYPVCEKFVENFDYLYGIFDFGYDIFYQIKRYS